VTLVLTTHYMEEAAQLCDRLVIMDGGRIVRMGSPRDLVAREVGREVVELRAAPADAPALVAALDGRLRGHRTIGDLLVLYSDDADAVEAALRGSAVPHRVETRRPATLEDVFLAITGHSLREER
jgi:lipooligosaccharide transport system ATP-binding protein